MDHSRNRKSPRNHLEPRETVTRTAIATDFGVTAAFGDGNGSLIKEAFFRQGSCEDGE